MSSKPRHDWFRSDDGVRLGDVVAWSNAILDDHGLWTRFSWAMPMPSQRKKSWGCLTLFLCRWDEGKYVERIASLRNVRLGERLDLEAMMLHMICEAAMRLDRGDWEAERARLAAGGAEYQYFQLPFTE